MLRVTRDVRLRTEIPRKIVALNRNFTISQSTGHLLF